LTQFGRQTFLRRRNKNGFEQLLRRNERFSMSAWSEVRRLAERKHDELASSSGLVPAATLLNAAETATGVKRRARPPGDPLLDNAEAAYDRERARIYFSSAADDATANFYIAHEYGHHWLEEAGAACFPIDLNPGTPAEPEMSLVGDPDAYSPKERAEAQANLFAREFLLPRTKLRKRCSLGKFDAATIAGELGVPRDLVMQQLADALLLPEEPVAEEEAQEEHPPDKSQEEAIVAEAGPRQVRAGPGSGKTRTLVGRVAYLLAKREDPSSILALTYSNMSAQDLASRIRKAVGEKATAVWAGTFHAYGYELLRKYGRAIGLPEAPKLLDRTDSLMLLQELLLELELNHYLNLHEPALTLRSILGAIGRAKDDLATPEDYERFGRSMLDTAKDPKAIEAAERALEVARAYAVYDRTLRARGLVDFGDLIARSVELLRAHPEIRAAVRAERRHILVDEYQDMNRASGILLKELVEPGRGPWVVGDVRQAIYRFRGASPLNMSRFADDFPGAKTTDLSINYRSGGRIIRAFEAFGGQMTAARLASPGKLEAFRGEDAGRVLYEIASTREAEAEGVASAILGHISAGGEFQDHAILARTHTMLARLARHLERAGVPCLYFGDFFERPEVRDLLALVSLVSEPMGPGLLRVAQMPQYAVRPEDIALVIAWRRAQKIAMLAALQRLAEIDGLSSGGRDGLQRLSEDVGFVEWPMSAHSFLKRYLFGTSSHLEYLLAETSVAGQQQRLAVYQLLQFAFSFKPSKDGDPKRGFVEHVRRLEILDEEKQLRQLPAAARDINAVKLMTIHASKGLEFPVVHITSLAKGLFPPKSHPEACPPPAGMILTDELLSVEAEEESLFFVGMSRARDELHLSRALTNGKASTPNPSRFLEHIRAHLPKALGGAVGWISEGAAMPAYPKLAGRPPTEWTSRAIETYQDCPLKFYYAYILLLWGREDSSPYLQFQSAVHSSIAWMRQAASAAERRAGIVARFENDWSNLGPKDDPYGPFYRSLAQRMLQNAISMMEGECLELERSVTLPKSGAVVSCRLDHAHSRPDGITVLRLKASRLAKTETDKARYVLWQEAVSRDHPGNRVSFEHVSLLTGERRASTVDRRKIQAGLTVIDDVVQAVARGKFDPNPGQHCPTCPYFFVCPSHAATC
jgi:superfamily I DNA/RNA helicase